MKIKSIAHLILIASTILIVGCTMKEQALVIQKPFTYDNQYYENLRAYKQSKHTLCFGWEATYQNGAGYLDPASWGNRIAGIPDSMDIISMWGGIPSNDPKSGKSYGPVAYSDWKLVSVLKGTKFVAPVIVNFNGQITLKDSTIFDCTLPANRNDSGIHVYGKYLVDMVLDNGVDGLDIDWEPSGGEWLNTNGNFLKLVQYIGGYLGPDSASIHKDKIFDIDFYSQAPPAGTGKYCNYFIRQAYSQGTGGVQNAANLQSYYNTVAANIPPGKFIVTENLGDFSANGGTPFTEANGNTLTTDGSQMYSLEGMARWNPTQGQKAGFGGFYFDRDYYSGTGIPYYNVRRCIQIANPAVR